MKKLINVFGSPGSGKSTFSLYSTYYLKSLGYEAEYAPEYIKSLIANNMSNYDQLDILHHQYQQISACYNSDVNFVVTDSPILNAKVYGTNYKYYKQLLSLAEGFHNSFNNLNILITPCQQKQYKTVLRLHNYSQSISLYNNYFNNLINYDIIISDYFNKYINEINTIINLQILNND